MLPTRPATAPISDPTRFSRRKRPDSIGHLARVLLAILFLASPGVSIAEGSREIVDFEVSNGDGDSRWLLNFSTGTFFSPLAYRTILYVYVQSGETVSLGSSTLEVGDGNIYVFPRGSTVDGGVGAAPTFSNAVLDCDSESTGSGDGVISTRAQEIAGPLPASGGYTPCVFDPDVDGTGTGIYPIVFRGPTLNQGGTPGSVATPSQSTATESGTGAWDVTVRNSGGVDQPGRLFTNAIFGREDGDAPHVRIHVLTKDGHQYTTDFTNLNGFFFNLFSNNQGLRTLPGNERAFQSSTKDDVNGGSPRFSIHNPEDADGSDGTDVVVNKIFFNTPDPIVVTGTRGLASEFGFLPAPGTTPPSITNFEFDGTAVGGAVAYTPNGAGGTFTFDSPVSSDGDQFALIIDADSNASFEDAADRLITGTFDSAGNSVDFDGLDGNGVPLAEDTSYNAQLFQLGGEIHFPFQDVENLDGITTTRVTLPTAPFVNNAYYNDDDGGTPITNTSPVSVLSGADSSAAGFHGFSGNSGNEDWVDTWTFFPLEIVTETFSNGGATPEVAKSIENIAPTGTANEYVADFRFVISNPGIEPLTALALADDFLAQNSRVVAVTNVSVLSFDHTGVAGEATTDFDPNPDFLRTATAVPFTGTTDVGVLDPGDVVTLVVRANFELDPGDTSAVTNSASVSGADPGGNTNTDLSDGDGTGSGDPNGTGGDPDANPSPLPVPVLDLQQTVDSIAATANPDEFTADLRFVITNIGNVDVDMLTLVDDFLLQNSKVTAVSSVSVVSLAHDGITGESTSDFAPGADFLRTTNPVPFSGTAGVDTLAPSETLTLVVRAVFMTNPNDANPITSLARVAGDDPSDNPLFDDSDGDGNPAADSNGTGGANDANPTPLPAPLLDLQKRVEDVTATATPGEFTANFRYTLTNTGTVAIDTLALADDFVGQNARVTGVSAASVSSLSHDGITGEATSDFSPNPNFLRNGTAVSITGTAGVDSIAPGEVIEIVVAATFQTSLADNSAVTNAATASGQDPSAAVVTDASDGDGDPDSDVDSTGGATDANPSTVAIPLLDLAMNLSNVAATANPNEYIGDFTYVLTNTGDTTIDALTLTNDFVGQNSRVTGVNSATVQSLDHSGLTGESTGDFAPGTDFLQNGSAIPFTGTAGVDTLDPGESITVVVRAVFETDPGDTSVITNSARAAGTDPASAAVFDDSDGDADAASDVDSTGGATHANPTRMDLPALRLDKTVDAIAATSNLDEFQADFRFVLTNTGNVVVDALALTDDFLLQNAKVTAVSSVAVQSLDHSGVTGEATTDFAPGADFMRTATAVPLTGTAGVDALAPAETLTLVVRVVFMTDPNEASAISNSASATGDDPADSNVFDTSDGDGDPAADGNGTGGANDANPTPVAASLLDVRHTVENVVPTANPGEFTADFRYVLDNTGAVDVDALTLVNDFLNQNPGITDVSAVTVSSLDHSGIAGESTGDFVPGTDFLRNGTPVPFSGTAGVDTLSPGDTLTLVLSATFQADLAGSGVVTSRAIAAGTDPTTAAVSDVADGDGNLSADTNSTGGPNDANPALVGVPMMDLAKTVVSATTIAPNRVQADFQFVLENTGSVALDSIALADDFEARNSKVTNVVSVAVQSLEHSGLTGETTADFAPGSDFLQTTNSVPVTGTTGVDTLASGETLTLVVRAVFDLDPDDPNAVTNAASASASDPDSNVIGDDSDGDGDPASDANGTGGAPSANPTPLGLAEMGVAKNAVSFASNGSNVDVTFDLAVQNLGSVELDTLSLVDDLETQLGSGAFIGLVGAPAFTEGPPSGSGIAISGSYDGTASNAEILASGGSLDVGETFTIRVVATMRPQDPSANLPLENQATASGAEVGNGANTTSDPSGDGTDPAAGDDATSFAVGTIGVALEAGTVTENGDGQFNVPLRITVENLGLEDLTDIDLSLELASVFPDGYTISSGPTSATLSPATGYDGNAVTTLLDGTDTLTVGSTGVVELVVTFDPGAATNFSASATAAGRSPVGIEVTDVSVGGLDPDPDGDGDPTEASENVATQFSVLPNPQLGLAKTSTPAVEVSPGVYETQITVYAENLGNVDLGFVEILDDLGSDFAGASPTIVGGPTASGASTLILNGDFDGVGDTALIDRNLSFLGVGETGEITYTVRFTPSGPGAITTSATGSGYRNGSDGTGPPDTQDVSTAGTNPDPDDDGDPSGTGEDAPTPVVFGPDPRIGVAQSLTPPTLVSSGPDTYRTTVSLVLENLGNVELTDVQLEEDLRALLPPGVTFSVSGLTAQTLTVAPGFDGDDDGGTNPSDILLLAGGQTLAIGQTETLSFVLDFVPNAETGPFALQATGTASNGGGISDLSDSGLDPDPNGDGDAGGADEDDATPMALESVTQIGVAKQASPVRSLGGTRFEVDFTIVVENFGNTVLSNVQVVEDLTAAFPSPATYTITTAPVVSGSLGTAAAGFDGDAQKNLLAAGETLAIGEQGAIDFTVEFDVMTSAGPFGNQVSASASGPMGETTADLSTEGDDPDPNGDGDPSGPGEGEGTAIVPVSPAGLSGSVYVDRDGSGTPTAGDENLVGWIVELYDEADVLLGSTTTDSGGNYTFADIASGQNVRLRFLHPESGVVWGEISPVALAPGGNVANQNLAIDPSGVVYDDATLAPLAGVSLRFVDSLGNPVSTTCLAPGQQNQTTGSDGRYRFDLQLGQPGCALPTGEAEYAIEYVSRPSGYGDSILGSVEANAIDATLCEAPAGTNVDAVVGGECEVQDEIDPPALGDPDRQYFLRFLLAGGDQNIVNNHIPLTNFADAGAIVMAKQTSRPTASIGDMVAYTVTATNTTGVTIAGVTIEDRPAPGLKLVEDSAILERGDGLRVDVSTPADTLHFFGPVDLLPNETVTLTYLMRVGAGVAEGPRRNHARPIVAGVAAGNTASARVDIVADPVFERTTIIGKVFADRDGDGWQDSAVASRVMLRVRPASVEADGLPQSRKRWPGYRAGSTTVDLGTGPRPAADHDGVPAVFDGLSLGRLGGIERVAAPLAPDAVVRARFDKGSLSVLGLALESAEGWRSRIDRGETVVNHRGAVARGETAQDLTADYSIVSGASYDELVVTVTNRGRSELGIPGVRLATVGGLLIETDRHGRYHIADVDGGDFSRGRNFILKLDTQTLPVGAVVTTENPRVLRMTQALMGKINFGVALPEADQDLRPLHVRLGREFFEPRSESVRAQFLPVLLEFAREVERRGRARVTIQHLPGAEERRMATARVAALRSWLGERVGEALATQVEFTITSGKVSALPAKAGPPSVDAGPPPAPETLVSWLQGVLGFESNAGDAEGAGAATPPRAEDASESATSGSDSGSSAAPTNRAPALAPEAPVSAGPRGAAPVCAGSLCAGEETFAVEYGDADSPSAGAGANPNQPISRLASAVPEDGRLDLPGGGVLWITEDATAGEPRLDVYTRETVVRESSRDRSKIVFHTYSNYPAFSNRYELMIFAGDDDDRVRPLRVFQGGDLGVTNRIEWDGRYTRDGSASSRAEAGDEFIYVLRVHDGEGHFDETRPRRVRIASSETPFGGARSLIGPDGQEVDPDEAARQAVFGRTNLGLQRIPIRGSRVRLHGEHLLGDRALWIEGQPATIDERGRFAHEELRPLGRHVFAVEAVSDDGSPWQGEMAVDVDGHSLFVVGLADVTLGGAIPSGAIDTLNENDEFDDVFYANGRFAFYLKGKIQGKYLITAHADTREESWDDLVRNLDRQDARTLFRRLDPDRFYPVYGDDSTTVSDVDTAGRFYLRVDWDGSQVIWGNYDTGFTGNEFTQYNRSLYGGKVSYKTTQTTEQGEPKLAVDGFAALPDTLFAHNEFLGTGGSLYYLKHQDIAQGSEKVWVEIRDRDTDRVIENITLERGRDYEIDEIQGRIILSRPLTQVSTQTAPAIIRDTPLDGNDVYMLVDYEYFAVDVDPSELSYGGRVKGWLTEFMGVGGTYVQERRDDENYQLWGVDTTLRLGRGTSIKGEFARSEATQAPSNLVSTDGGLRFAQKQFGALAGGDREGDAIGVEARVDLDELSEGSLSGAAAAWWKRQERGFSSARRDYASETIEYGAEAQWSATDWLRLSARGSSIDRDRINKEQAISAQVDLRPLEDLEISTEMRWINNESVTNLRERALLGGLRVGYDWNDWLTTYVGGQATIDGTSRYDKNHSGQIGLRAQVTDRLGFRGEVNSGTLGTGVLAGLDWKLNEMSDIYGSYTLSTDRGSAPDSLTGGRQSGIATIGQRSRISNQVQVFNEQQFRHDETFSGFANVFGIDWKPQENWSTGFSLQSSQLDSPSNGISSDAGIERHTASVWLGFDGPRVDASTRLEWRLDKAARDVQQWLTTNRLDVRLSDDYVLLTRVNFSKTTEQGSADRGLFSESSLGFAYRPVESDRLNALAKYTFLYDLPTVAQSAGGNDERAHVLAVEALYDVTKFVGVGGKYAYKYASLRAGRDAGKWFETQTHLGVAQVRLHVIHNWDLLAEYRALYVDEAEDVKHGPLVAVYRHLFRQLKVGAGYSFVDFNDDLTRLDYRNHGWFVNFVGKF